jgi:hypothetical protein
MKYYVMVALLALSALSFATPQLALAQPASLVPCGTTENPGECTVCDFVSLGQRIINFFVFASVVVATLLFVNAGALYIFSPGNPGNISKGHRIFTNTLVGILFILVSWIVVDFIMRALVKDELIREGGTWGPWNEILCRGGPIGPAAPAPAPAPVIPAPAPAAAGYVTSAEAMRLLREAGIELRGVSEGGPVARYVVDDLIAMDRTCGGCVTVTSLSGGGHSSSASGHYRGIKADIGLREADAYIQANWREGAERGGRYPGTNYIGPGGTVCVRESTHYDCCFRQTDNLCT